jgi:hypothetical protein
LFAARRRVGLVRRAPRAPRGAGGGGPEWLIH